MRSSCCDWPRPQQFLAFALSPMKSRMTYWHANGLHEAYIESGFEITTFNCNFELLCWHPVIFRLPMPYVALSVNSGYICDSIGRVGNADFTGDFQSISALVKDISETDRCRYLHKFACICAYIHVFVCLL